MVLKKINKLEPSSFRDPSGHIFYQDDYILRQVNDIYKKDLDLLVNSGLMAKLIDKGLLVSHIEDNKIKKEKGVIVIFKADKIPFISYPYEWSFSQLKDAALVTLEIQKLAIENGMSLKDASSYNIQFINGKPIFIDLLSFEEYQEGKPWVAYEQFCQHFIGPLLLMSKVDADLNKLLRIYINGVPLRLVSKLLPKKTYLSFSISSHIHLHARNQSSYADSEKVSQNQNVKLSKFALLGIIDSLESLIKGLKYGDSDTEWGEYYTFTNYTDQAFQEKKQLVEEYLNIVKPKSVWDIGANNGEFSRLASQKGILTVASDIDPVAVEKNYIAIKNSNEENLLPLVMDLTNPSPAIGWNNQERKSLIERGPSDVVFALALIHHLAISNNLPFSHIAGFCKDIGKNLIIEFVPKDDSKVQKLLATREDIFTKYTQEDFEKEFSKLFKIVKKTTIPQSKRTLYLMKSL